MKQIGLVGGTSWVSTVEYYTYLNQMVNAKLGGSEFVRCVLISLNFGDLIRNVEEGRPDDNRQTLVDAAQRLKLAGAEAVMLGANTMHMFAEDVKAATGLPLIHIGDATAKAIVTQGLSKVSLLGTKLTMERSFIRDRLNAYGLEVIVPGPEDREFLNDTVLELGKGILNDAARTQFISIMESQVSEGAQGVILGCTEFPLLVSQADTDIPLFNTTRLHCEAAIEFILGERQA